MFHDCEIEEGEEPLQCEAREPRFVANDSSCSIAPTEAPPTWALALRGIATPARGGVAAS